MTRSQTGKIILLNIVLFSFLCGYSQETVLDSLLNVLKAHTNKDSTRVNLLISTSWNMTYTMPEDAFPYVEEAITISRDLDWLKGQALALRQKGNLHYVMADNLRALDAFQKALVLSQNIKDKSLEASLLSNIGNIHADLKEYEKALEKYQSFLSTALELKQKSNQVKGLTNIAIIYNDIGRHEEGINYLKRALTLAEEEDNEFFVAAITNNLGLAYKGLEEYDKSLDYYDEARLLAKKIQNKYIEASALNSLGKVNVLLCNYDIARLRGIEALKLSQEIDAVEWQADSWKVLSTVYENQGKPEDALEAYKNHIQFRDSVLGEEKKSELTRKEMLFELEKQEAVSKAEIQRQRLVKNGYLAAGILLVLGAIIAYFLYKKRRDTLEKKKVADFKTKVAETELKALRSQMNPHFIFNSLNSIRDFISKNNRVKANEYLQKFAKLTRSILESSEKKWISLEDDLELMELYIQLESLRLQNKLTYGIEIDPEIDKTNTLVPPLILQPFIENSIWHGIAAKEGSGHINIEIKKEGDIIVCVVDDDGVGRTKSINSRNENRSMGVKITSNRLEIINQLKKSKGSIEMFDKPEGLRVELKIPLELQF